MTNSPQEQETDPRVICFQRSEDEGEFEASVATLIGKMQEKTRRTFVSEQNVFRINHGSTWAHTARKPEPDTVMHTISAEWTTPFKDIVNNDLSLISRAILPMNEDMERQFSENIYKVVGAAAEQAGNVVNAQTAGSFAQSMLEMWHKIELGVDRDGNVSMPQLHVSPETFERIQRELENAPPELEAEIEKIKAQKSQLALAREAERKAKFKRSRA